jgi:hypothetical protein
MHQAVGNAGLHSLAGVLEAVEVAWGLTGYYAKSVAVIGSLCSMDSRLLLTRG